MACSSSFKDGDVVDGETLDVAVVSVEPVFSGKGTVSFVLGVELVKLEVVVTAVVLPLLGDLEAAPHPHTLDLVLALRAVDAQGTEGVLAEVVDVTDVTVLEVVGQVVDDTLT